MSYQPIIRLTLEAMKYEMVNALSKSQGNLIEETIAKRIQEFDIEKEVREIADNEIRRMIRQKVDSCIYSAMQDLDKSGIIEEVIKQAVTRAFKDTTSSEGNK